MSMPRSVSNSMLVSKYAISKWSSTQYTTKSGNQGFCLSLSNKPQKSFRQSWPKWFPKTLKDMRVSFWDSA